MQFIKTIFRQILKKTESSHRMLGKFEIVDMDIPIFGHLRKFGFRMQMSLFHNFPLI